MRTGVYLITCTATGKRYVGSAATSFARRYGKRMSDARAPKHVVEGRLLTFREITEQYGIGRATLYYRLKHGVDLVKPVNYTKV